MKQAHTMTISNPKYCTVDQGCMPPVKKNLGGLLWGLKVYIRIRIEYCITITPILGEATPPSPCLAPPLLSIESTSNNFKILR
jgi:hypothetical protein